MQSADSDIRSPQHFNQEMNDSDNQGELRIDSQPTEGQSADP